MFASIPDEVSEWIRVPNRTRTNRRGRCVVALIDLIESDIPDAQADHESWFAWARALAHDLFDIPPDADVTCLGNDPVVGCFCIYLVSSNWLEIPVGGRALDMPLRTR